MKKLTRWFKKDSKPVRRGVYETRFYGGRYQGINSGFSYWNGRVWTNQTENEGFFKAYGAKRWIGGAYQEKQWRGLAADPKAGVSSKS